MKLFKKIILILIVFLETGNLLSNNNLFNVNNILLEKKENKSNNQLADQAIKEAFNQSMEINYLIVVAVIFSFLFSYMTVKFFLSYINRFSLNIFIIYRIFIAFVLFKIIYF